MKHSLSIFNSKRLPLPFVAIVPMVLLISACQKPVVTKEGTVNDAIIARAKMGIGQEIFPQIRAQAESLFAAFGVSPVARKLMFNADAGGQALVVRTEIVTLKGDYQELTAGTFSFTPDLATTSSDDTINIQYLNGVDLTLTSFVYDKQGYLSQMQVQSSANNRSIVSPVSVPTSLHAKVIRTVAPEFLNWLQPATIAFDGNIETTSEGVATTASLQMSDGEIVSSSSVLNTKTSYFRLWDVTNTLYLRQDAPYWHEETTTTYALNASGTKWYLVNYAHTYADSSEVYHKVNIFYDIAAATEANSYAYNATSDIRYNKVDDNDPAWYKVATISGGPYICSSANVSSGTDIQVAWYNEELAAPNQAPSIDMMVLPSPTMDCATLVKNVQ